MNEQIIDAFYELRIRHNIFIHVNLWKIDVDSIFKCLIKQAMICEIELVPNTMRVLEFRKIHNNAAGLADHAEIIYVEPTRFVYVPFYDLTIENSLAIGAYDDMFFTDYRLTNSIIDQMLSDEERCFLLLKGVEYEF